MVDLLAPVLVRELPRRLANDASRFELLLLLLILRRSLLCGGVARLPTATAPDRGLASGLGRCALAADDLIVRSARIRHRVGPKRAAGSSRGALGLMKSLRQRPKTAPDTKVNEGVGKPSMNNKSTITTEMPSWQIFCLGDLQLIPINRRFAQCLGGAYM